MNKLLIEELNDHSLLSEVIPQWDFNADNGYDILDIEKKLVDTVKAHNAVGLAANQIGIKARAFVMNTVPPTVCFNPIITGHGDETDLDKEGCLSYPGLIIKIKRYKNIRVRFQNTTGQWKVEQYTGMAARCFQHELDHLEGITFKDRANKIHLEQAKKKLKLYNRRK